MESESLRDAHARGVCGRGETKPRRNGSLMNQARKTIFALTRKFWGLGQGPRAAANTTVAANWRFEISNLAIGYEWLNLTLITVAARRFLRTSASTATPPAVYHSPLIFGCLIFIWQCTHRLARVAEGRTGIDGMLATPRPRSDHRMVRLRFRCTGNLSSSCKRTLRNRSENTAPKLRANEHATSP